VSFLSLEQAVAAIVAVGFLFALPGVLGMLAFRRAPATRETAPAWSLAANSVALILVCLLLRSTVGVHRGPLIVAWSGWNLLLLGAYLKWRARLLGPAQAAWPWLVALGVGLATVAIGVGGLFPEQFCQCFNEDGTETYELARSLRSHFLPHWELETREPIPGGRIGTVVVNPSLINSYWTCGLQTLMRDAPLELPARLSYWVWSLGIFLVSFRLVRNGVRSGDAASLEAQKGDRSNLCAAPGGPFRQIGPVPFLLALPLALLMLLGAALFTFYVGYNPYMADIANPGVPDALFTLLLLLSFDCLRRKDRWGWTISIVLASLVLYAGPVMLALTLAAVWWWRPLERKETLRWGLSAIGLSMAVALCYAAWGWWEGSLRYWLDTLDIEYVQHYMSAVPRLTSVPLFFGYFVLGAGGITVLGLFAAFRRDAWQRTVATVTLAYLVIVLGSGFKNLHWFAPLWPMPVILFLMPSRRGKGDSPHLPERPGGGHHACMVVAQMETVLFSTRRSLWRPLAACGSLLLCLWVCWPQARSAFSSNRDLGRLTTIATNDELTAATWARLRLSMRAAGMMSWDCDEWTWVVYAELDPRLLAPRPLVLTDGGPPSPEYRLLATRPVEDTSAVAKLYYRGEAIKEWLRSQHPKRPLERYPCLLRPLADGKYSPHNNDLEDMRWLTERP
jgi:hypothetical protein